MRRAKKDITQDKKATTQDKKDILGTKRAKQGHSGQKGLRGTFLGSVLFPWARVESTRGLHAWSPRVESTRASLDRKQDMYEIEFISIYQLIIIVFRKICNLSK